MTGVGQDIIYGLRALRRSPGFAAVAVFALALGIGANTAIFSVVNQVLLRPLPFPHSESLITPFARESRSGFYQSILNPAAFSEWQAHQSSFEDIAVYVPGSFNLSGGDRPVVVSSLSVSASFLPVLGVPPSRGRGFAVQENQPGQGKVVVISDALWRRQFNSDPEIVGRAIRLDTENYTVIGVMPANFRFLQAADVITPAEIDPTYRRNSFFRCIARLKPGVTLAQAQAETETLTRSLDAGHPGRSLEIGARLVPLHELTAVNSRRILWILFGAVGFVLLIACANLANLLLARSTSRQKEIAVRSAIGASRWRIIRQLLTESATLAILGGCGGLLLAWWGVDTILAFAPETLSRVNAIAVDGRAFMFTAVVSFVTGILFGLVPALRASKQELTESLKEGTGTASSRRFGFREGLVTSEVALTLILLVGAGLLINSLLRLISVKPGFVSEHILTLDVNPPTVGRTVEQLETFYTQVLERLSNLPGVQSAAAVNQLPLGERMLFGDFRIEGRPEALREPYATKPLVGPGYFKALSIPLIKGREFNEHDTSNSARVAVISENLARTYFAGEEPLGKRVSVFNDSQGQPVWREVVGVVGDVRQADLGTQGRPTLYAPYTQAPRLFTLESMTFAIRSGGDPVSLAAAAQREIQAVDKDLPIARVKTLREVVYDSVSNQRFNALLLGAFGTLALVLAAIGIFGVMSYAVAQRTREIGIRMALGAQPADVVSLVTWEGMLPALVGVAIGLGGAFALTRFIASMLFGIQSTDPLTFCGMAVLLMAVALASCYVPARRAARVDPILALRNE